MKLETRNSRPRASQEFLDEANYFCCADHQKTLSPKICHQQAHTSQPSAVYAQLYKQSRAEQAWQSAEDPTRDVCFHERCHFIIPAIRIWGCSSFALLQAKMLQFRKYHWIHSLLLLPLHRMHFRREWPRNVWPSYKARLLLHLKNANVPVQRIVQVKDEHSCRMQSGHSRETLSSATYWPALDSEYYLSIDTSLRLPYRT